MALKRYVNGADGEFFFQKRAPSSRPDWIETVELRFPSGRTAHEIVVRDAAQLAWIVNLGCIDLNPHPVRADDLDHPDELRVDLDPVPGFEWEQIVEVAIVAREVLADHGLAGWPKTSGSRGIHVYARIEPRWTFTDVRRAAVALAREVERREPASGDEPMVEGGAPRRVHRLQPERQGPNGRIGLLGAADARRARLDTAHLGRGARLRPGRVHRCDGSGAVRVRSATRRRGSTTRPARSNSCSRLPIATMPRGSPDAPWPPTL